MLERGRGHVVNINSRAAVWDDPAHSSVAYSTSKAGLARFTAARGGGRGPRGAGRRRQPGDGAHEHDRDAPGPRRAARRPRSCHPRWSRRRSSRWRRIAIRSSTAASSRDRRPRRAGRRHPDRARADARLRSHGAQRSRRVSVATDDGGSAMSFDAPVTAVGPGTPAGTLLRRHWQPVALAGDIDAGAARPVRVLGEDLTLYRDEPVDSVSSVAAARTGARSCTPVGWRTTASAASTTAGSTTHRARASNNRPSRPGSRRRVHPRLSRHRVRGPGVRLSRIG